MRTVFALSSAVGKCAISVVRVTGPEAFHALDAITSAPCSKEARRMQRVTLVDPDEPGEHLDDAMACCFHAPNSFTGEHLVEIYMHGSPSVVNDVLNVLSEKTQLHLAEPGEFTRRAFENGKLDLTEAEAVADLIEAETKVQRKLALSQLRGTLSALYEGWRQQLLESVAVLEATIDFEEDEMLQLPAVGANVSAVKSQIEAHLKDSRVGERVRTGCTLSLFGPPNSGKSSLFNALLKRRMAIVTDMPGTTRDVLEGHLDVSGFPVVLEDTAGIRDTRDTIEAIGIGLAKERVSGADLAIAVFDARDYPDNLDEATQTLIEQCPQDKLTIVLNKCDLLSDQQMRRLRVLTETAANVQLLSCAEPELSGAALASLEERLGAHLRRSMAAAVQGAPLLTRARHRGALLECLQHLRRYQAATHGVEVRALELRGAVMAVASITGHVTVDEHILGHIFSSFCIGK